MKRRGFLGLFAALPAAKAAAQLQIPEVAAPIPPAVMARANSLLSVSQITKEALRILHKEMRFTGTINRNFDPKFRGDQ